MRSILILATLIALVWAPAAEAARGDRADARAFAAATTKLRAGVVAQKDALETGVNRLSRDPVCVDALRHVPGSGKALEAAFSLVFAYEFEAQLQPVVPALQTFVADLGSVDVRDHALRSGRAALRRTVRSASGLQPAPADVCTRLQTWQQAGYPAASAPKIDDPATDALLATPDSDTKKIDRAGKRLRQLGISRRVAAMFAGDDTVLFRGLDLDRDVPVGNLAP
jgi:hypothetical protein